mmetsp:Transcript_22838/g.34912  ORF Transcript_22838/g.34912 Transcript_22838/m.34912 type:complete len:250 (+) Transcript_22838:603-1352(+)
MKNDVPNPTACNTDHTSPQPTSPSPPSPPSSNTPTPTKHVIAAIQVWGASANPIFFLSTNTARAGQTMTTSAPRKLTVAAGVSTKAILCEMYPNAVNVPHTAAVERKLGLSCSKKGDSASEARSILVEVAAEAGRASFINLPNGKFVPYNTEQTSKRARGQRYSRLRPGSMAVASGFTWHTTSLSSSSRVQISGEPSSATTHTPRAHTTFSNSSSSVLAAATLETSSTLVSVANAFKEDAGGAVAVVIF